MMSGRMVCSLARRALASGGRSRAPRVLAGSTPLVDKKNSSPSRRYLSDSSSGAYTPGIGIGKTSTGLVGLAVEPDWYNVMLHKFQLLLDRMEASDMPETAQYRVDVTKWCNYVIETVRANPNNPEAVEDAVNMGQVEELIEMADDEMLAMDVYLRTRMWELVEQSNPSVDFNPDPTKDPFAHDGDPDVQENLRQGMEAKKDEQK